MDTAGVNIRAARKTGFPMIRYEGRRIQKVEEGWLLLNGKYYDELMQAVNRRAYKAQKERERRERLRAAGLEDGKLPPKGTPLVGEVAAVKEYEEHGTGPCA